MTEKWIEKYHQRLTSETPKPEIEDDFDLFDSLCEPDHVSIDTDKAWDCICQKIGGVKQTSINKTNWFISIAASVVLAIAAGYAVYEFTTSEPTSQVLVVADQGMKTLSLPDGSIVTLTNNSTLEYSESFTESRNVRFQGEAFFEITKSDVPFHIETKQASIEVLGTSFLVNTHKNTQVSVTSGTVSFKSSTDEKLVNAGQSALVSSGSNTIEFTATDPNELSWKTGKFVFADTPLHKAIGYLNKYYDVNFVASKSIEKCKITASFDKESISNVTKVISTILNIESPAVSNKEIHFAGKGCN